MTLPPLVLTWTRKRGRRNDAPSHLRPLRASSDRVATSPADGRVEVRTTRRNHAQELNGRNTRRVAADHDGVEDEPTAVDVDAVDLFHESGELGDRRTTDRRAVGVLRVQHGGAGGRVRLACGRSEYGDLEVRKRVDLPIDRACTVVEQGEVLVALEIGRASCRERGEVRVGGGVGD